MSDALQYGVLGAGRQGTAAGYDLAVRGGAARVMFADRDPDAAARAADTVNRLANVEIAEGASVDVTDHPALVEWLAPRDVVVCAVPFVHILGCTQAAIEAATGMVDLGGHTETVLRQLEMDDDARRAGIAVIPDCGMGPGMNNTLGLYTIERLRARGAHPREVRLWDGGLPQQPPEPWGYQSTFHINGLTNEYDGQAVFLRAGRMTLVDALTEPELIEFPGVGTLEAFVTSGGTSTVPHTLLGELEVYENKTCRYPGHYAQFKAFKDLGLFGEQPVEIAPGEQVVPRRLYHALLGPQLAADQVRDVCVIRARGTGELKGKTVSLVVDLVDRFDPHTGFTAMERLTGWHAAIMAAFVGHRTVSPGVRPVERALPATTFLEEVRRRGFTVDEHWEE